MPNTVKLSDRLKTIAGFIEKGATVADIGTDHGYLPAYLAQTKHAGSIIASDISAASLGSAQRTAIKHCVDEQIRFVAAPGLDGLSEESADTIVIAGMGGETIAGIVGKAPWTKRRGTTLVLQPQTKASALCCWLSENGYAINEAALTRDKGRYYLVMRAEAENREQSRDAALEAVQNASGEAGIATQYTAENGPWMELLLFLKNKHDPLFAGYIKEQIAVTRHAAEAMKNAGAPEYAQAAKMLAGLLELA